MRVIYCWLKDLTRWRKRLFPFLSTIQLQRWRNRDELFRYIQVGASAIGRKLPVKIAVSGLIERLLLGKADG